MFRVWRCAGVQREVRPNGGTGCSLVYNFVSCLHVGSQKRIFKTIKDCLAWASFACLFLYFLVLVSHTRVSTTHSTRTTVSVTRLGGYRSLGWSSSPPPPPLGDNVAVRSTGITIPRPGVGPH